jgi:hypothetical protein
MTVLNLTQRASLLTFLNKEKDNNEKVKQITVHHVSYIEKTYVFHRHLYF